MAKRRHVQGRGVAVCFLFDAAAAVVGSLELERQPLVGADEYVPQLVALIEQHGQRRREATSGWAGPAFSPCSTISARRRLPHSPHGMTRRKRDASTGVASLWVWTAAFDGSGCAGTHFSAVVSQASKTVSRSHDSGCSGSSTRVIAVTPTASDRCRARGN